MYLAITPPRRATAADMRKSCAKTTEGVSLVPLTIAWARLVDNKWNQTCLYSEASEYLWEESHNLFWTFLETLTSQPVADRYISSSSFQDDYERILQLTLPLLSPSKKSILKFSLSLRSHSPTVEMFNQMSKDKRVDLGLDSDGNGESNAIIGSDIFCPTFVEFSRPSSQNDIPFACDVESAKSTLTQLLSAQTSFISPLIYKSDHIHPESSSQANYITAILYGHFPSSSFSNLYNFLKTQVIDTGRIKLLIRHYIPFVKPGKVSLSGYGVELAIKSTEYKAQDDTRVKGEATSAALALQSDDGPDELEGFVFSKLKQSYPDSAEKINEFHTHLIETMKEIATFKVWELQDMSLQAAKKIISSPKEDQLRLLKDIAQNFPSLSRTLINIPVDNDLKKEVERNQHIFMHHLNLGTSDSALFVNGMFFDMDTTDIFTLLHYLKKEVKLIEGLHKVIGQDQAKIKKLIKLDVNDDKQEYQIDIRDSAVMYVNDIENDKMYRSWSSSLQDMLRPTYPGMLRNVRKNMYHLVLIIDPSKKESFDIIKLAESFYVHKAPLRIGFVFAVNKNMSVNGFNDAGVALLNAFNYITETKTPYDGLSFLTDVIASIKSNSIEEKDLNPESVVNLLKAKFPKADLDLVFGSDSNYDTGRKLAWDFLQRTGLTSPIKVLMNGVVLKQNHLNSELFEEAVLTEIMRQTPTIQKAVYKGELTESKDILDWLMSQKTVMPRLNQRILNNKGKIIDLVPDETLASPSDETDIVSSTLSLNNFQARIKYIISNEKRCSPITLWIAADYEKKEGRRILLSALSYLRSNNQHMRLGIIYSNVGLVSQTIEAALSSIRDAKSTLSFLIKYLVEVEHDTSLDNVLNAHELVPAEAKDDFKEVFKNIQLDTTLFNLHHEFISKIIELDDSKIGVVVNGRVIEIPTNESFVEDDFSLVERHGMLNFGQKILEVLDTNDKSDPAICSNLVMKISNVLSSSSINKMRHELQNFGSEHSAIILPSSTPELPTLDVTAIVEPLSRGAQKLAPILMALQKVFNINIRVYLNCIEKHSDMPLKNYFRYVIDSEMHFADTQGSKLLNTDAYFGNMPLSPLFTLGMITPENWLVESVTSPYDLDNIHLEEIEGPGVWADFELEYLLLEGHCFEQSTGNPPRGLQFILGSKSDPDVSDTIVMANLGYFQLKANPGAWTLRLRPGRSDDIYSIVSHENTDPVSDSSNVVILISSFQSNVVKIRVNKKPDKQDEELLYDDGDDDENSLWGSISSWTGGSKKKQTNGVQEKETEKLNIFSLASGHLYERLLRIMMLSVIKHTKTPVKFWFLKNYLSPTFKDFLPTMAEKYGFEYELVQYKWPRWLHQQTEKQRIIWGYKILFLDVLFPLDVKKIIFVDADQVVRVDLTELRDLDLEGAPYGYTPFCDSREDMDGFRFWKTGYWANHLHGRKYHISALYVVDLQRFRRIAAGDRLRGQYQGLSQDPNSLSNLDQDLPNNMIHQVPIKSLPQEWLWCETWCDDGSKSKAKTIDLCNNPKTKEPKLTAARRILPEWEAYDNEIKELMREYEESKQSSTMVNEIEVESKDTKPTMPGPEKKTEAKDSAHHTEL
uniref:UDP-glucose:glycoprotein glucosyltransferase n=1 Tax=Tetranychus urticae TaxID=32264 RepID=T1KNA5_TETUR